jgi:4-amino-4-deoxy-L-arabinose transferase-like glycosyltransferase
MPLDPFSPRPSLASTHAPETVVVTVTPNLPASLTDHAVSRLTHTPPASGSRSARTPLLTLIGLWLLLYVSAAFTPPLLDDADATHAQAAQSMLATGDWVTLHVDGIRYLEKPPLPYWITAASLKLFAPAPKPPRTKLPPSAHDPGAPSVRAFANGWDTEAFAVHFPLALTILGLVLLGYAWARRAFNDTAALTTGLFLLTSTGVFLFTRVFIPDALLSLLLAFTLYAFLRSLNPPISSHSLSHQDSVIPSEARSSKTPVILSEARSSKTSAIPSEAPSGKIPVILSEAPSGKTPVILGEAPSSKTPVILSEARSAQPKDPEGLPLPTVANPFPSTNSSPSVWPYAMWLALALAVLTKGLVAIVFILATTLLFLFWTRQLHQWRNLRPLTGTLLFLAIAAPWHILAGLRNTGGANGHGFFWFYFINEHVLRFLGRRIPRDYNKLPTTLYWLLHLVWLFPWSLFAPAALVTAYRKRRTIFSRTRSPHTSVILSAAEEPVLSASKEPRGTRSSLNRSSLSAPASNQVPQGFSLGSHSFAKGAGFSPVGMPSSTPGDAATTFRHQTTLLLIIFSTLVLAFFSLSTNQEYYTFPVYLPLLMLLAAALSSIERNPPDPTLRRALTFTFATYTTLGLAIAAALAYGLWSSRHLPFVPDIGDLLAHRSVGDYTLSMSHFFDLTGPSFAALRLPAALALTAFLIGPAIAWVLYAHRRFLPAILSIAATSSVFLIAAHIAFVRFNPMLSSVNFAETIQALERTNQISPNNEILIYGDQAFGSSIPFYLHRQVELVDGRTTSMLFGSTFPDAPPIFLTSADLLAQWGHGPRKLLFVPLEQRDVVDQLLGSRQVLLQQTSGKALITDRPLQSPINNRRQSGTPGL